VEGAWSAAYWCRERGVGRGSLVRTACVARDLAPVVYVVTHVGREVVVGRAVCTVAGGRNLAVAGGVDYERAWCYGCQLDELTAAEADAVTTWLEREV
jgi:hypothetical protein